MRAPIPLLVFTYMTLNKEKLNKSLQHIDKFEFYYNLLINVGIELNNPNKFIL